MPDEALIAALDGLRDSYSQRQKVTQNILSAFQGTASTLTKTGRALRDYLNQGSSADSGKLSQSQAAFEGLRLKEDAIDPLLPDLKREIKWLASFLAALRDTVTALRSDPVDAVKLSHAYESLGKLSSTDSTLNELMPAIAHELDQAQASLGMVFGQALRDKLVAQGIGVAGQPPNIEIGRFEVVLNVTKRTAAISYGKELLRRVPLSVDAVIAAYLGEVKNITGRAENGTRWIGQFYDAWEIARKKRDSNNIRANIVDCYFELVLIRQGKNFHSAPAKKGFTDYSRAQFTFDFFEFGSRQRLEVKGLHIHAFPAIKAQAGSPDKSLWIVEGDAPHAGNYIGDVVFDKD